MKLAPLSVVILLLALVACGPSGGEDRPVAGQSTGTTARTQQLSRRMWTLGQWDDVYDVTPDGRYAGYIDWQTGNLMLRDLETGTVRNVTNKGTYDDTDDEAESVLFSRDGKWVAYEWWNAKAREDELRIASLDGSTIRTLRVPSGYSIWPEDWTPDGKYVITLLDPCAVCGKPRSGTQRMVAAVPVGEGEMRTLTTIDDYQGSGWVRLSPDGKYAVYAAPLRAAARGTIEMIDLATLRQSRLFEDSVRAVPVGWTNANTLIFVSERGGSPGVWSIAVVNGRAQGSPQLIRGDLWNLTDMQRLAGGKLFYDIAAGDRDVFTAGFDAKTGRLSSQPVSVTRRPGHNYRSPSWSPDGRSIAYLTIRPGMSPTITVRAVDGGEVRELRPELPGLQQFAWLPNGRELMLIVGDQSRHSIYRYDWNSNTAKLEVRHTYPLVTFSRDARHMYYVPRPISADSLTRQRLVKRDLQTGAERDVFTAPARTGIRAYSLSADGKTALLVVDSTAGKTVGRPRGLWSLSLEDGRTRDLGAGVALASTEWMRPIGQTPDRKYELMLGGKMGELTYTTLWRVPLAGGNAIRLEPLPTLPTGVQTVYSMISPDGSRIMYVTGELRTELWALDDPAFQIR